MKKINRILFAAAVATILTSAGQVMAQSQLSGPDGLATSPRLRQQILERQPQPAIVAPVLVAPGTFYGASDNLAAPPRTRQLLSENRKTETVPGGNVVVTSAPRSTDNIVASPRLREQLQDQQPMRFQIAPVK